MEHLQSVLSDAVAAVCQEQLSFTSGLRIEALLGITVDLNTGLLFKIENLYGVMSTEYSAWGRRPLSEVTELKQGIEDKVTKVCWEKFADVTSVKLEGLVSVVLDNREIIILPVDKTGTSRVTETLEPTAEVQADPAKAEVEQEEDSKEREMQPVTQAGSTEELSPAIEVKAGPTEQEEIPKESEVNEGQEDLADAGTVTVEEHTVIPEPAVMSSEVMSHDPRSLLNDVTKETIQQAIAPVATTTNDGQVIVLIVPEQEKTDYSEVDQPQVKIENAVVASNTSHTSALLEPGTLVQETGEKGNYVLFDSTGQALVGEPAAAAAVDSSQGQVAESDGDETDPNRSQQQLVINTGEDGTNTASYIIQEGEGGQQIIWEDPNTAETTPQTHAGIIVEGFDQNNQRFQITLPSDGNVTDADIQEAARILMADLNSSGSNKPQMNKKFQVLRCDYCTQTFDQRRKLLAHISSEHEMIHALFSCKQCGKRFSRDASLKRHLCTHSSSYKCTHCDHVTNTYKRLQMHMRIHSQNTPYSCYHCSLEFGTLRELRQHLVLHPIEKLSSLALQRLISMQGGALMAVRKCFLCPKQFGSFYNLKKHLLQHKTTGWVAAKTAMNAYINGDLKVNLFISQVRPLSDLALSKLARPNPQSKNDYDCRLCSKTKFSKFYLMRHLELHKKKLVLGRKRGCARLFNCDICNRKFATDANLRIHVEQIHILENKDKVTRKDGYKCTRCDRSFASIFNLERHLALHQFHSMRGEKAMTLRKFQCTLCTKSYGTEEKLSNHYDRNHNEHFKKEPVEVSQEEPSQSTEASPEETKENKEDVLTPRRSTRARKRKYPDTPPGEESSELNGSRDKQSWPCRLCKRKCSSVYNLERHEKLHEKYGAGTTAKRLKQFQCEHEGCFRGFGTEDKLKRHLEEVHGDKKDEDEIKVKEEKTAKTQNFICVFCGQQMSTLFNLQRHETRWHSENPPSRRLQKKDEDYMSVSMYECPICTETFLSRMLLANHVKSHASSTMS